MEPRALVRAPDGNSTCPICRSRVVVADQTQVVIKNAILRADRGSRRVAAKCARCKSWLEVPLTFTG